MIDAMVRWATPSAGEILSWAEKHPSSMSKELYIKSRSDFWENFDATFWPRYRAKNFWITIDGEELHCEPDENY